MPHWRGHEYVLDILDERAAFLRGQNRTQVAQFGEDSLLEALFQKIGVANRWCFEVGAGDGVELSNTKVFRDAGWSALLIESDDAQFATLSGHASARVRCVRRKAEGNALDVLLKRAGAPTDLDLGVVDVDGQDFWIWSHLKEQRPRVMLVEFNPSGDQPAPAEGAEEGQAGFTAICELGRAKGYVPLAKTNVNIVFALRGILE